MKRRDEVLVHINSQQLKLEPNKLETITMAMNDL